MTVPVIDLEPTERVALVCHTRTRGRAVFDAVAATVPHGALVRRANGVERIEYPNGSTLTLMSSSPVAWRGTSFDRVVAPDGVPTSCTEDVVLALMTGAQR